jgi:hypothetical protein
MHKPSVETQASAEYLVNLGDTITAEQFPARDSYFKEDENMKPKIVMFGTCPNCGKEYQRKLPADAAACTCGNPDAVLVPLVPVLDLPSTLYKSYSKIAELAGVSVEQLVNELLTEAAREYVQKLEALKALPSLTVTVKRLEVSK